MGVFCAKFQNACIIKTDCSEERDFARVELMVCFGWVFYIYVATVHSILNLDGSRIMSMSTGQYILRQMFSLWILPLIIKLHAGMSFAECTQQSFDSLKLSRIGIFCKTNYSALLAPWKPCLLHVSQMKLDNMFLWICFTFIRLSPNI